MQEHLPCIIAPKLCLYHKVCHKSQEQFCHVWGILKQKTATDATWKESKNLNSHNKPLNAITQVDKICYPQRWFWNDIHSDLVSSCFMALDCEYTALHITSVTPPMFSANKTAWSCYKIPGPRGLQGDLGPDYVVCVLHFSTVSNSKLLCKWQSENQSFQCTINIFSWSALAGSGGGRHFCTRARTCS